MLCNRDGQVHFTYKFLLARSMNLIIVNSSFLTEWSKTDEMPKLADFSVCLPEDFSSVPKVLPPLTDEKMFHNLSFTLNHDHNMLFTFEQIKVAVEALGGVFWEQEQEDISMGKMPTRTCFNIGGTYEPGKGVVSSEWITDMIVWGRRLHHKGFEMKEGSEDAGEEQLFTQAVKKAKVSLGLDIWDQTKPCFCSAPAPALAPAAWTRRPARTPTCSRTGAASTPTRRPACSRRPPPCSRRPPPCTRTPPPCTRTPPCTPSTRPTCTRTCRPTEQLVTLSILALGHCMTALHDRPSSMARATIGSVSGA